MKLIISLLIGLFSLISFNLFAGSKDDPWLTSLIIDQFEYSKPNEQDRWALESEFWTGKDLDKFWLKIEVEKEASEYEEAELQALYSKAIMPYWDLQVGVRRDFQQPEEKNWAVLGLKGLAPYYFEVDTAIFVGNEGDLAVRFAAEYEMLLTQQWILTPEIEVNAYAQNDPVNNIGSGLSDISLGLRLRYEFTREFSIHIGLEHEKVFGNTANLLSIANEPKEKNNWIIGISGWF